MDSVEKLFQLFFIFIFLFSKKEKERGKEKRGGRNLAGRKVMETFFFLV
jgi:hypothetical protein